MSNVLSVGDSDLGFKPRMSIVSMALGMVALLIILVAPGRSFAQGTADSPVKYGCYFQHIGYQSGNHFIAYSNTFMARRSQYAKVNSDFDSKLPPHLSPYSDPVACSPTDTTDEEIRRQAENFAASSLVEGGHPRAINIAMGDYVGSPHGQKSRDSIAIVGSRHWFCRSHAVIGGEIHYFYSGVFPSKSATPADKARMEMAWRDAVRREQPQYSGILNVADSNCFSTADEAIAENDRRIKFQGDSRTGREQHTIVFGY